MHHLSSPRLSGIWLPLITPFIDGALDETSLTRLVAHYVQQGIDGLIVAATTGEGLTLDDAETEQVVALAANVLARRIPLFLGLCGSDTRRLVRRLAVTDARPVDGYLITCPYYSRPSQQGLYQHFAALADATDKPILVYNIPYRTGVNLGNDTLLRLAERANIVGVKDCCADAAQSADLLRQRSPEFAVLTGEDALFYGAITHGADGGVLASAHIDLPTFAAVQVSAGRKFDRRVGAMETTAGCGPPAVRRTQSGTHQARAVATWPDRIAGIAVADDRDQRVTGGSARSASVGGAGSGVIGCGSANRIDLLEQKTVPDISPIHPSLEPAVLALNNAHAVELSWLERDRLAHLLRQAFYARRIGKIDAFLLAFDECADYDSPTTNGSVGAISGSFMSTVSPLP